MKPKNKSKIEINNARKEQLRIAKETERKLSLIKSGKATPDQLISWGGKTSVESQLAAQENELKTLDEARKKHMTTS